MLFTDEGFFVGFYWGPRKETAEAVARRAYGLLQRLREISSVFTRWEPVSEKKAGRKFTADLAHLEVLARAGVNRTDVGNEVIPDLGFRISLLSKACGSGLVSLRITAGGYSKWVSNVCVIELPPLASGDAALLRVPTLVKVCESVIAFWEPDSGQVGSPGMLDLLPDRNEGVDVGWFTYLVAGHGEPPQVSPPSRVLPVNGKGHLIIATDGVFSCANPEHVKSLRRIDEALNGAVR